VTHHHGLGQELAKLLKADLLNLAHSAGSNQLQINRLHEHVLNNQIDRNDLIYWQITQISRKNDRLQMDRFNEVEQIQKEHFSEKYHHYICQSNNIFDKKKRIDILSNSPLLETKDIDVDQDLETLLSTIILTSYFVPKIIVAFGWQKVMESWRAAIFKTKLKEHNINFLEETYLEYVIKNNLEMEDDMHPARSAGEIFSKKIIHPKLISLGWC